MKGQILYIHFLKTSLVICKVNSFIQHTYNEKSIIFEFKKKKKKTHLLWMIKYFMKQL